jgi:hypothetical protein
MKLTLEENERLLRTMRAKGLGSECEYELDSAYLLLDEVDRLREALRRVRPAGHEPGGLVCDQDDPDAPDKFLKPGESAYNPDFEGWCCTYAEQRHIIDGVLGKVASCSCKRSDCPHVQKTECEACFQKRGPIAEKSVAIWHRETTCCTCGNPISEGGHVMALYVNP